MQIKPPAQANEKLIYRHYDNHLAITGGDQFVSGLRVVARLTSDAFV